jgi:hypothetical protein
MDQVSIEINTGTSVKLKTLDGVSPVHLAATNEKTSKKSCQKINK